MRLFLLLGGALATVLLAAGCGGGGDDSASGSVSKEAFIAKADAICKHSNERMEDAFVRYFKANDVKKPNQAEYEKLVGLILVPNIKREVKELRALGVPDGDDERVDGMITALEEGIETAEEDPEVVARNSSDTIFGIASRIAKEYGLEICGSR